MHKQETKTQTQTTVWWLPEGMRVGIVQGKGGKYKVIEGDLTLGMNTQCSTQMVYHGLVHLKPT